MKLLKSIYIRRQNYETDIEPTSDLISLAFWAGTDMHEWPAKLHILAQVIFHMAFIFEKSLPPQETGNSYMSLLNNFFIIHLKNLKQRLLCTTLEVRMILKK